MYSNSPISSYLKRLFESQFAGEDGRCGYITNGALVQAALELNLPIKDRGLDAKIGINIGELRAHRKMVKGY